MEIHGWGRYPRVKADVTYVKERAHCVEHIARTPCTIGRGLGRSYGDSSLAEHVLATRHLDHFLDFDTVTGILRCAAGVTLDELLRVFVPRGWFLPVTPGTRFVTIGGAIASDVHGKNHHIDGSFGSHVTSIELLLGNGEMVEASPSREPELFHATCGGMGLTGIILSATLRLKPIRSSLMDETTIRAPDLEAALCAFEQTASSTYSVAWIDSLANGKHLGRSLLMTGEHADRGPLTVQPKKPLPVPVDMPDRLLNRSTVKAFNALYYRKARSGGSTRRIPFEPFFYPLDALSDWNRLYGKQGFVQYQFVLPKEAGIDALRCVLERVVRSGRGSFLAVLKTLGKGNQNLLSFPMEGYTLALDFKAEPAVFRLLDELDGLVLEHGGRIYLAKDARMSEATFKACYPRWQEFEALRARYHAVGKYASAQSKRLGLQ